MNLVFREATQPDLPAIVRLLADDEIGCRREAYADPLPNATGPPLSGYRRTQTAG